MRSPAAKIQIVTELYNKGLLCKCKKTTTEWIDGDHGISVLIHRKNCAGKKKMLELLQLP